ASAILKCLLYFDTIEVCGKAVETLRKCLLPHLRHLVQEFQSELSEAGKAQTWDQYNSGQICLLCTTDAAGMGCNVPDIQFTILVGLPKSASILGQHWGRTARDRMIEGTCILLV
ncbi:P-loop containing nucleoside triphosphate hydrolase protein, partial [Mycena sanguinolenta]